MKKKAKNLALYNFVKSIADKEEKYVYCPHCGFVVDQEGETVCAHCKITPHVKPKWMMSAAEFIQKYKDNDDLPF